MIPNPQLENLIAEERYAELLACLTPGQLAVVALRLEDLPYDQIAELLGLTRQGVYYRMQVARQRLAARCPHLLRYRVRPFPGSKGRQS